MHRVVMCDRVLGYHPMHVRDQPNPPKLSAEWCQRSICWIPWWSFYLRRPPHPCPSKPFGSSDLQHVIAGVNLHWPMKPNQAWKEDQDLAGATATKPFFFLGVTHTPPPNHHPFPFPLHLPHPFCSFTWGGGCPTSDTMQILLLTTSTSNQDILSGEVAVVPVAKCTEMSECALYQ